MSKRKSYTGRYDLSKGGNYMPAEREEGRIRGAPVRDYSSPTGREFDVIPDDPDDTDAKRITRDMLSDQKAEEMQHSASSNSAPADYARGGANPQAGYPATVDSGQYDKPIKRGLAASTSTVSVRISSADRIVDGTSSPYAFSVLLTPQVFKAIAFRVQSVSMQNDWYNISAAQGNNTLIVNYNGANASVTITIPDGAYSVLQGYTIQGLIASYIQYNQPSVVVVGVGANHLVVNYNGVPAGMNVPVGTYGLVNGDTNSLQTALKTIIELNKPGGSTLTVTVTYSSVTGFLTFSAIATGGAINTTLVLAASTIAATIGLTGDTLFQPGPATLAGMVVSTATALVVQSSYEDPFMSIGFTAVGMPVILRGASTVASMIGMIPGTDYTLGAATLQPLANMPILPRQVQLGGPPFVAIGSPQLRRPGSIDTRKNGGNNCFHHLLVNAQKKAAVTYQVNGDPSELGMITLPQASGFQLIKISVTDPNTGNPIFLNSDWEIIIHFCCVP